MGNKRFLLIYFIALLNLYVSHAQVSQDLIDKAKDAGVSNTQIQHELGRIDSQQGSRQVLGTAGAHVSDHQDVRGESTYQSDLHRSDVDDRNTVYGREIFRSNNLSFAPSFNIPTPKDYQLAAGDELLIYVWGDSEMSMSKTISPEGTIFISNVGPVALNGLTVEAAENKIRHELGRIMSSITSLRLVAFGVSNMN